jgi:hypothetical protein
MKLNELNEELKWKKTKFSDVRKGDLIRWFNPIIREFGVVGWRYCIVTRASVTEIYGGFTSNVNEVEKCPNEIDIGLIFDEKEVTVKLEVKRCTN